LTFYLFTEPCCNHAEGGVYIGPEFQLGQVYDGTLGIEEVAGETVVLYRPVYVHVSQSPHRMSIAEKGTLPKDPNVNK
jgi:hypothetical protein